MVTGEALTLAVILIAPGVISVVIGVSLGVIEEELSREKFYLSCFISSLVILVIFIWLMQAFAGYRITDQGALESVFFRENGFNVAATVILFLLSCFLGVVYGLGLTYNISHFIRGKLAYFKSHQRNPWQPWVGGLRDAEQVMVQRNSGSDVIGILGEYSRVEKERQIVLLKPQFLDLEEEPNREKVIIAEEEIAIVHVMTTNERIGFWKVVKIKLSGLVERVN